MTLPDADVAGSLTGGISYMASTASWELGV